MLGTSEAEGQLVEVSHLIERPFECDASDFQKSSSRPKVPFSGSDSKPRSVKNELETGTVVSYKGDNFALK